MASNQNNVFWGGGHSTEVAYLLFTQQFQVWFSAFLRIFLLMLLIIINGTAVNSGERLDNINQIPLVLASGKRVLLKCFLPCDQMESFMPTGWLWAPFWFFMRSVLKIFHGPVIWILSPELNLWKTFKVKMLGNPIEIKSLIDLASSCGTHAVGNGQRALVNPDTQGKIFLAWGLECRLVILVTH